jgi:uncharacterized membrane protein
MRYKWKEYMNTFTKAGLISAVIGMFSASFAVALQYFSFGLREALDTFFIVLPKSLLVVGLPSLILTAIVLVFWEKPGKSEKGVIWIGLIIGLVIGLLGSILLSYGWQ